MNTKLPKRTLISNKNQQYQTWMRRNNSSTVCSLLTQNISDDEEDLPRRVIFSKSPPPHDVFKGICRDCYCKDEPISPALKCENLARCGCRRKELRLPKIQPVESVFLKHSPPCRKKKYSSGFYTNRRQNYENSTSNYFLDSDNFEATDSKMKELMKFRKQNYFQCHSTCSCNTSTKHTCEHRFKLNDRLVAEPEKTDEFGVSRCSICSKPITEFSLKMVPKSNVGSVVINCNNEKLIFTDNANGSKVPARTRRTYPSDSMALRFQKGVS